LVITGTCDPFSRNIAASARWGWGARRELLDNLVSDAGCDPQPPRRPGKSISPTGAIGPQSVKRGEHRGRSESDGSSPGAGRSGERTRTRGRTHRQTPRPTRIDGPAPKRGRAGVGRGSCGQRRPTGSGGERGPTATPHGHQERGNRPHALRGGQDAAQVPTGCGGREDCRRRRKADVGTMVWTGGARVGVKTA
jgi:hypothetical protein